MSTVIEDVKSRIDLVELVGKSVSLKKVGQSWRGLCPFHSEKTASFYVRPETRSWYCFGCSKHGDCFDWLVERQEQPEFIDALRFLAQQVGVDLDKDSNANDNARKLRLLAILGLAQQVYAQALFADTHEHRLALMYLHDRGVSDETIRAFGIGYAPDRRYLLHQLKGKGFTNEELHEAGVANVTKGFIATDFMSKRIVFPIRDASGRTIAFGGRALGITTQPKYLNTRDSIVFHKQDHLYGYDLARKSISDSHRAVIVEGYMDVVTAHQNGFTNVVATLGTAVSDHHLKTLRRQADEIVLAMDPDIAGKSATWRALQIADDSLRVAATPSLGANREQHHVTAGRQTELKILTLPEGRDPDDVIREEPDMWRSLLSFATPVASYVIGSASSRHNLESMAGKRAASIEIADVLSRVSNPVEQAHYVQLAANILNVNELDIRQMVHRGGVDRLDLTDEPAKTDSDSAWDEYAIALFFRLDGASMIADNLRLTSSEGRAYWAWKLQHPDRHSPSELEPFRERMLARYDELEHLSDTSIRTQILRCSAALRRRALLRERANLLALLRDAQSDDDRAPFVASLNRIGKELATA